MSLPDTVDTQSSEWSQEAAAVADAMALATAKTQDLSAFAATQVNPEIESEEPFRFGSERRKEQGEPGSPWIRRINEVGRGSPICIHEVEGGSPSIHEVRRKPLVHRHEAHRGVHVGSQKSLRRAPWAFARECHT